jgi:hypothetical protein
LHVSELGLEVLRELAEQWQCSQSAAIDKMLAEFQAGQRAIERARQLEARVASLSDQLVVVERDAAAATRELQQERMLTRGRIGAVRY